MRTLIHYLVTFAFAAASPVVLAGEAFEANFAKAQENAKAERGAAYDAALSEAFAGMADFQANLSRCLEANPGPHSVRGYFFFFEMGHQVVLEPKDNFTFCLSPALASPSLPKPPGLPYLNPFTFTFQP